MAVAKGTTRSATIMRMKEAVKTGQSASSFIRDMQKAGLSYRRTTMLSDWRSVGNVEKKTGLLKYVRKAYQPSPSLYAEVKWNLSREYLYKVRVETRLKPTDRPETRYINIVNDKPMTPREIETEVQREWGTWYPEQRDQIVSAITETGLRRVS